MLQRLRWACRRCSRGREFWEVELAPEVCEGAWFFRCGACGEPVDTSDVLGASFIIPSPETGIRIERGLVVRLWSDVKVGPVEDEGPDARIF